LCALIVLDYCKLVRIIKDDLNGVKKKAGLPQPLGIDKPYCNLYNETQVS